jgi:hypothetical protein
MKLPYNHDHCASRFPLHMTSSKVEILLLLQGSISSITYRIHFYSTTNICFVDQLDIDYNAVCLLDAPKDSVIDAGVICKHICLIFCMVKVYYLTPVCSEFY